MFLFGLLLFRIHTGALPYAPDSTYGFFLVIVSLQIITMGKTPFGDFRRSWTIVITGICMALLGMSACFIPGLLTGFIRVLVGLLLCAGGIALLMQLFFTEEKAKKWIKVPGILRQLTIACGIVYFMTVILGIVTVVPGITTDQQTALLLMIYGTSFFYLAWCIRKVAGSYPSGEVKTLHASDKILKGSHRKSILKLSGEASLSMSGSLLILIAVLITLLGLLLFPVYLGLLPFSPDGQLGLVLFIVAVQMLAMGDTPVGQYKRSWSLMITGVIFAAMGIISCIVPGLLTGVIAIFLGLLNITGGVIMMIRRFVPILRDIRHPPAEPVTVPPMIKKLIVIMTLLNVVSIILGITVFAPGLIAGPGVAGILVINGLLLFVLTHVLQQIS